MNPSHLGEAVPAALCPEPRPCPLLVADIPAGFPSPADDFVEDALDIGAHLVRNPVATFFVRAAGDSMLGAGIHPGDLLVVDRSLAAHDGACVIAQLDGELCCKRLRLTTTGPHLISENPRYQPIVIADGSGFTVWGVVTAVIHRLG